MKNKFIRFCNWAQANWLALIIFMVIIMLCFVTGLAGVVALAKAAWAQQIISLIQS
ncbi:hypothetical protein Ga0466249_004029 [Sporomusaceae bacterium BoRhaA]|uniref:hypothetical protein n=1 Tax=Pelorhabdus rhamnosifermentans TaxID=2772457 RepID=UPI001C063E67|nr:hypothetical protein [Pelorhabdus rhamnosifermentans]MBU2702894.1 hypothetical protein [Pelorhabdus rhamnosifermentans]